MVGRENERREAMSRKIDPACANEEAAVGKAHLLGDTIRVDVREVASAVVESATANGVETATATAAARTTRNFHMATPLA
jgi:hypothetical protein